MLKIKNLLDIPIDFVVNGPIVDGVPPTKSIGAGATEDIDIDPQNPHVVGRVIGGAIKVVASPSSAPTPPAAPPVEAPPAQSTTPSAATKS